MVLSLSPYLLGVVLLRRLCEGHSIRSLVSLDCTSREMSSCVSGVLAPVSFPVSSLSRFCRALLWLVVPPVLHCLVCPIPFWASGGKGSSRCLLVVSGAFRFA